MSKLMRTMRLMVLTAALCALASAAQAVDLQLATASARIGRAVITVELAANSQQRYQGLSGRTMLPENHGMLFVYPSPRRAGFVMRKMLIPLDFVWIKQGKVVGLNHRVPPPKPGEKPVHIPSPGPIDRVLEINAGWIKANQVKLGDTFELQN